MRSTRLAIFATHPVQYHVPLWRALARHDGLSVKVFYFSDQSLRGGMDRGFGVPVTWDVDLESGYQHAFVSRDADLGRPSRVRIPDLRGLLADEEPDWAMFAGYTHGFERQLAWARRRSRPRLIMRGEFSDSSLEPRGRVRSVVRSAALRSFYSRVDRFCYPGEVARRHLVHHGVDPGVMWRSPYAVDDQLIAEQRRAWPRDLARRSLGIPDDAFVFVLSGKLIPRKDPLTLARALALMPRRERVWLLSLGDGELRQPFDTLASDVLGDRFLAPGFVNQAGLGRYFGAGDSLVFPSRYETWGLVANEAMHHGLCVLASDRVDSHEDLVREGTTGYTFPAGDAEQLAQRMQELVDDPVRSRRMGAAGAAHAQHFTVQEAAAGVVAALDLDRSVASSP